MDIKNFTNGGWGAGGLLFIQKNKKATRTVPILK